MVQRAKARRPGRRLAGSTVPALVSGVTVALAIGVFYVGLYPRHLFEAMQGATNLLFA